MFFRTRSQRVSQRARCLREHALAVEPLEDRILLKNNYFILDFTPDYHAGSMYDTFMRVKTSSGYAPKFFDFDNNGYVNARDVQLAAAKIATKVRAFYAPFLRNTANRLSIQYGDVTSNSNWGYRWTQYGRASTTNQVIVMYLGGTNRGGSGILGIAPLANGNSNIEGYGETYTRTIANMLLRRTRATTADFVNSVANTAAHELGHMMGLRHATRNSLNIMSPNQQINAGSAYFVRGNVNTSNGYQQNAYTELDRSFQLSQSQIYARITSGQFQWAHEGCRDHADVGSAAGDEGVVARAYSAAQSPAVVAKSANESPRIGVVSSTEIGRVAGVAETKIAAVSLLASSPSNVLSSVTRAAASSMKSARLAIDGYAPIGVDSMAEYAGTSAGGLHFASLGLRL